MPEQCPECGRFLARAFVAGLGDGPQPCPRCGAELTADLVGAGSAGAEDATMPEAPSVDDTPSVRPPDLAPDAVRQADVLEGWDRGSDVVDLARWRDDRQPFPVDAVAVAGGLVVGAAVGAVLGERRGRNAALGAVVGTLIAAASRRIWQLE